IANNVELQPGENTILAELFLRGGQMVDTSITVTAEPESKYITLQCLGIDEGLVPLDITLQVDGEFLFEGDPHISCSGPGVVDFDPPTGTDPFGVAITNPGIYYFTAEVDDSEGNTYTDTIAVKVWDQSLADAMLREQWEGMKTALAEGDVDEALTYFIARSRDKYRPLLQGISDFAAFVNAMEDIEMIYLESSIAKYRIKRTEDVDGIPISVTYYIYFTRDIDGQYKVYKF
ncbi:MAG: hypothetical protein GY729_22610, partial [Desulfobacteraceae bacterium]|nr:hypothetical protein [Desulfobacteraceae bacterium]